MLKRSVCEQTVLSGECTQQGVPRWEKQNGLKASLSGKSSFYTHAHVKEGAVKEVRRMERCNERGEEHSFMSCLTQGHKKVPQAAQLGLRWTVFPTLLALFYVHFFSGWICVSPREVSHCQYIESRSSALRSVPIQARTVAPGQNASPCSAPSLAAPLPPTLPTLPLARFSCSCYTAKKFFS